MPGPGYTQKDPGSPSVISRGNLSPGSMLRSFRLQPLFWALARKGVQVWRLASSQGRERKAEEVMKGKKWF